MTNGKLSFEEIDFGEGISYIAPTWEEMGQLIFDLGKLIIISERKYDWIISIAKGGWTWSRALADYLNIDNLASVKAKLYEGIGQTSNTLVLEQTLPEDVDIKDKKILLFDDITDTGQTFAAVKNYLLESGAKSVDSASLFYKQSFSGRLQLADKPTSVISPNFCAYQTKAWVIFPHEIREFITLTKKSWKSLSSKEIFKRYKEIGLLQDQVEFFFKRS